jgi:hypothetical protein
VYTVMSPVNQDANIARKPAASSGCSPPQASGKFGSLANATMARDNAMTQA